MKTSIYSSLVIAAALLLGSQALAQGNGPTVMVSSLVTSKYLAVTGAELSNEPAVQSNVFVGFKNGMYADLWNSRSLKGRWNDGSFGNEIDYGIGWSGSLTDKLSLDVSAFYFDEPKAFTFDSGDIVYLKAALTRSFKNFSLTAGCERYVPMPGSTYWGGSLVSLGAKTGRSYCENKLTLSIWAQGFYDTGSIVTKPGFLARGGGNADWKENKRVTINVIGFKWFAPMTAHDKRKTTVTAYTGITVKFN